jgi:hypothetical protein
MGCIKTNRLFGVDPWAEWNYGAKPAECGERTYQIGGCNHIHLWILSFDQGTQGVKGPSLHLTFLIFLTGLLKGSDLLLTLMIF